MNFILFNPDEMRAESLGCYGHPVAPTPNIDALAAEGTRFDQCHVQHPVCTPSRCSFMTGWYPHVRGHRTLWHPLQPEEPNLLRYFKQAGYEVLWGGKNDLLSPGSFADSVTDYRLGARSTRALRPTMGGRNPFPPDDPRYYSFLYESEAETIEQLGDFAQVDGAIEFLKTRPQNPFMLYLPISFPHCPYFAPGRWQDLIDPNDLPPLRPVIETGKPDFHRLIRETRRLSELDDVFFRKLNAVYLGMIGIVDELLGQLLRALDESGLAEDTTVLFFSDHGDWAGDYGLVEKWPSALDDTLTRVPMIVRAPGGKAGHVVREVTELLDLTPTVLDIAEIPLKHTQFGRSLVPQISGAPGDPTRAAFAEGGYALHEPNCFEGRPDTDQGLRDPSHIYHPKGKLQQDVPLSVCRSVMVRTQTHKLIHRPDGVSELYDLTSDPQELHNNHGSADYASVQSALEKRLLDWYIQTADVTPRWEGPRGFPARG
ncbi:MAG: sulfatase-like hydrolase/transferase [Armatimonadota bacterium]